jgi:hypothetical protein
MGKVIKAYTDLVEKLEEKRQLGRHKHRWECHIKTDFKEKVFGGLNWSQLPRDTE